jgi:hypothetical protein
MDMWYTARRWTAVAFTASLLAWWFGPEWAKYLMAVAALPCVWAMHMVEMAEDDHRVMRDLGSDLGRAIAQ